MLCLDPGRYTVRVECQRTGTTRVDLLRLEEPPNPALETSWGRVKALYARR